MHRHLFRKACTCRPEPRRTGYYVAGRDWPAGITPIPTEEIMSALEVITDSDVEAALASLRDAP